MNGHTFISAPFFRRPLPSKVDIIFNSTLVCPWDCAVCCVDAVHVQRRDGQLIMRSQGLSKTESHPLSPNISPYIQAIKLRQKRGEELTLEGKRRILDHLEGFTAKIDVSGGDALVSEENFQFLKDASKKLGKHNVTLTVTGGGSSHYSAEVLYPLIGEFNFTFDAASLDDVAHRPSGYALGNLKKAAAFAALGCSTRAELPLTRPILTREHLVRLYMLLHQHGIKKLLLMRLFPVGRGSLLQSEIPTRDEYQKAIDILLELEQTFGAPELRLQCALKHLVPSFNKKGSNPCDLIQESYGLMADGTLLASPWAINSHGKPLHPAWILGNLAQEPLSKILASEHTQKLMARLDENYGHCKIFSFLNSKLDDPLDRIFDQADPLYSEVGIHHPSTIPGYISKQPVDI